MAPLTVDGGERQACIVSPSPGNVFVTSNSVITSDSAIVLGSSSNSVISNGSGSILSPRTVSEPNVVASLSPVVSRRRTSNLERIKQRLRASESRLNTPVESSLNASFAAHNRLLSGEIKPYERVSHSVSGGDENQQDAVKALGKATVQLQRQLDRKNNEIESLQEAVDRLEKSLKVNEEKKTELEDDLRMFRRSIEVYSDQIHRLSQELEGRNTIASALREVLEVEKQRCRDLQGKLAAAHKDFEWIREETISKGEQIEYYEYQLLSKNDEIDNMHQELDKKLRRIVELEIDLETANGAKSQTVKNDAIVDSEASETKDVIDSPDELQLKKKRGAFGMLLDLKNTCHKHEDSEWLQSLKKPRSRTDISLSDTFPTDTSLADTTLSHTESSISDGSPSRDFLSCARRRRNTGDFLSDHSDIDRLRSALADLEARYKRDKYNNMKLIEKLKQENNENLIRIACMEKKLQGANDQDPIFTFDLLHDDFDEIDNISTYEASVKSAETPRDVKVPDLQATKAHPDSEMLPNKVQYLEQKVMVLENERRFHKALILDMRAHVEEAKDQARCQANEDKRALEQLMFDNQAKSAKIAELETASRFSKQSNDSNEHKDFVASMEARISEQFSEIARLHSENESKDSALDALRAELIDLRMEKLHGRANFANSPGGDQRSTGLMPSETM